MWSYLEECIDKNRCIDIPTESLFSKYGFWDGDLISAVCEDEDWYNLKPYSARPDAHEILMTVVRTLVLPHIEEEIELQEMFATCHNPCRAASVCGLTCEELHEIDEYPPDLHPETVKVSVDAIKGIAKGVFLEARAKWEETDSAKAAARNATGKQAFEALPYDQYLVWREMEAAIHEHQKKKA
jgi:hypothetical protein